MLPDTIRAWKQAGEISISLVDASRRLVDHAGAMTASEWDAQIKSIMAHTGRLTVDVLAADVLLSGAGEGAVALKHRAEQALRSIPQEQLHKLGQSLGKTRVLWDKAAEAFALERALVPALAGEAGALEGLSLAEQEAAELVLQAESTRTGSGIRYSAIKVDNMKQFFETDFGKMLEGKVVKLKRAPYQGQSLYQVTEKINHPHLQKGDIFYLDAFHKDHIEVFSSRGLARAVINLDGTYNEVKTINAVKQVRTIKL